MENRDEVIKKYIPSLVLFIAGFVIAFYFMQGYSLLDRIRTSFFVGWFAGGFIWGWSLTKKWFPNTKFSDGIYGRNMLVIIASIFRTAIAIFVGIIAMPVGIIMTIVTAVNAGKEAQKEALKAESVENSQENIGKQ